MPAGRPTTYKPEYCEQVIKLGKQGKSQVQIACALDVDPKTLRDWAERHAQFSLSLTRAKAEEQAWWENAAQQGMAQSLIGPSVWAKSVAARFREDYTDRQEVNGNITVEIVRFAEDPPTE